MTLPLPHLPLIDQAQAIGTALAAGLLVGIERGWRDRALPDGGRVAGLRTFALIALTGGVLAMLAPAPGLLLAAGLLAVAALFAVSFHQAATAGGSLSITSAVAALATFGLGALAGTGQHALALGAAVVVALLLDMKPTLHGWLRRIEAAELNAVLQLGVLTAVVLPLLPDRGYGPYAALNPYQLWLAVVLVAALSLLGHAAVRLRGGRQGLLWTGLLGGLASSTATSLTLARAARAQPQFQGAAAAGIVLACGVMFLRMAALVAVLQPALALGVGLVLVLLGSVAFLAAAWAWHRETTPAGSALQAQTQARIFDLPTALAFGVVLGLVAVAVRSAKAALGNAGIYGVAFLSGLADVDAILVSSVQMQAQGELGAAPAMTAIVLAAAANMLSKGVLAFSVGGARVGRSVACGFLAIAATGAAAAALLAS